MNVSKKVIQNVTDAEKSLPTEKFDFTAKFEFPAGTDAKTLGGVKDKDGKDVTLDATGQCTFQLGNGENMKFTGLPVGTTITVTEAAKANYKGSTVVTLNGVETSKAAQKYNEAITASGKLGQKKNIVDVTNRFNNVPTTGIINEHSSIRSDGCSLCCSTVWIRCFQHAKKYRNNYIKS